MTGYLDAARSSQAEPSAGGNDLSASAVWRDARCGRLTSLVEKHGAVAIGGLWWSDPETSLLRFASLLGDPVPNRFGPLVELSNSTSVPIEQRNKAVEWHQDDIHTPRPCRFTLLYGLETPPEPPATLFADLRQAFDALPGRARRRLRDLQVLHDPLGGRVRTAGEVAGRFGHNEGPEVRHPIVLAHPSTGRPQLFGIAGTAAAVESLADEVGVELLRTLKEWTVDPRFVRSIAVAAGSLIVWDNLALLHRATPVAYSDDDGYRRRVLRVTVT